MKVHIVFVLLAISLVSCEETSLEKNFNPISFLTCLGDGFSKIETNLNKILEAAKTLDFVTIGKLWTETFDAIKNLVSKCFSSNDEEVVIPEEEEVETPEEESPNLEVATVIRVQKSSFKKTMQKPAKQKRTRGKF